MVLILIEALLALVILYPLYMSVMRALSDPAAYARAGNPPWPVEAEWDVFSRAWNGGSLSAATWPAVLTVLPFAILGVAATPFLAHRLDLLALGERGAAHLGVNVEAVRRWSILLVALLTAAAVAVAGIIVFVGLVVPHAVRLVVGPRHRLLIPATAIAGAMLLVLADVISRTVVAPREIPLGVLTALIGSPVFFWLLRREHSRRGAWA